MNIYQELGYKNRKDYLISLAEDYGVPVSVVFELANLYGPSEDFDALPIVLEDYADLMME